MIDTTNIANFKKRVKYAKERKTQSGGLKKQREKDNEKREGMSESKWLMRLCVADTVSQAALQAGLYGILE